MSDSFLKELRAAVLRNHTEAERLKRMCMQIEPTFKSSEPALHCDKCDRVLLIGGLTFHCVSPEACAPAIVLPAGIQLAPAAAPSFVAQRPSES